MVLYEERSHGNLIQVVRTVYRGEFVQLLIVNGAQESAMFPEKGRRNELLFPYMRCFEWAMMEKPDIKDVLLIGGGGFSYPRYFLSRYPDKKITVAEISPEIVRISLRFFDLDRLFAEYPDRFSLIEGDGFRYLGNTFYDRDEKNRHEEVHAGYEGTEKTGGYDLIINDAFKGSQPAGNNDRDAAAVREALRPGGLYMVNLVSAVRGTRSRRRVALTEILKRHFDTVSFMACEGDRDPREMQNCLVLAEKKSL